MPLTIAHGARALLVTIAIVAACSSRGAGQAAGLAPVDDPFARRGWHLELGVHGALEAWNYNISHEEMAGLVPGFAYGLRDGLQVIGSWPMYFVSQRGVDAWLVGGTFGVRARVYRRERWTAFVEVKFGVSESDTYVPPRGTRFNYLAHGGSGVTFRIRRGVHGLAGLEWIHVSNAGLAGRDRNPDIEAVGPRLGILVAF
jgi:Lipid A 3-O-deacylase (PagL)